MRVTHERFAVTVAGIVTDEHDRVLLLDHVFRPGSGWGLPGGFINAGEQPHTALARELMEETGLQLKSAQVFTTRVFHKPKQLEIVFLCKPEGAARPRSIEVRRLEWFSLEDLPDGVPTDQKALICRALRGSD